MSTLVRDEVTTALSDAGRQCDVALARVASIGDGKALAEAKIAVQAATELARLNGMTSALRIKLTRLELHIARKAGQLGVTVKGVTRPTAQWFASKTDDEIERLIERHIGKSAPASIMRAEKALTEYTASRAAATQPQSVGRLSVGDAGESLAAIVTAAQDEFYDRPAILVSELADYVGDLVGIPTYDDDAATAATEGLRLGLWDAVRRSLANGELDDPRLTGLPRWITCKGRDDLTGDRRYNLRVPTAKATLGQLSEYAELLAEKGRQSIRRAEEVERVLTELRSAAARAGTVDGEFLGEHFTTVGDAAALLVSDLIQAGAS